MEIMRGSTVRIMRPESYWFQETGEVATVSKGDADRYGVTIRFSKVNYAGVGTNNFAMDELIEVGAPIKAKAIPAPKAAKAPANTPASGVSPVGNAMTANTVIPPLGGTSTFVAQMNTYNQVQSQKPSSFGANYFSK